MSNDYDRVSDLLPTDSDGSEGARMNALFGAMLKAPPGLSAEAMEEKKKPAKKIKAGSVVVRAGASRRR